MCREWQRGSVCEVEDFRFPAGHRTLFKAHQPIKKPFNGRVVPEKRPLDCLIAFKMAVEKCPDLTLKMVGTGWLLPEMKKYTHDNNLDKKVYFIGDIEDVQPFYEESDILITASASASESWGLVFFEARAYSMPIVGYDLPYTETFKDGRGIIKIPQKDISGLASGIVRLATDQTLYDRLSYEGWQCRNEYASFDLFNCWKKLFESLDNKTDEYKTKYTQLIVPMMENSNKENYEYYKLVVTEMIEEFNEKMAEAKEHICELEPLAVKGRSKAFLLGNAILSIPRFFLRIFNCYKKT